MSSKKTIDFVSKRKIFFIISAAVIAITIIFALIFGVKVDIQFKGGTMITYGYTGEISTDAVAATVSSTGAPTPNVTTGTSLNGGLQTLVVSFATDNKMDEEQIAEIEEALVTAYPEAQITGLDVTNVSATAGTQFFLKCFVAVIVAFILLVIYIAFRFKKISGWSAGVIAIICLLHDVIMVFAVFVFCRLSLDANFMAVILTILGYSINNTIIIYDRIRENRAKYGNKISNRELVNMSITQTLTRSIITTLTTFAAMVTVSIVATVMGVTSILSFSFPLSIGILVGFYSSICLAGPAWILWQEKKAARITTSASKKD